MANDFGVEWRDLPFRGGTARINGGDFLLQPLLPDQAAVTAVATRSVYPLQGLRFRHRAAPGQWSLFAGRAKRFRTVLGQEAANPDLFGLRHLRRVGAQHLGISFTGITQPTYVDEPRERRLTGVFTGTYYRDVSPWVGLVAEAHTTGEDIGARGGSFFKFDRGEVSTLLYTFEDLAGYLVRVQCP